MSSPILIPILGESYPLSEHGEKISYLLELLLPISLLMLVFFGLGLWLLRLVFQVDVNRLAEAQAENFRLSTKLDIDAAEDSRLLGLVREKCLNLRDTVGRREAHIVRLHRESVKAEQARSEEISGLRKVLNERDSEIAELQANYKQLKDTSRGRQLARTIATNSADKEVANLKAQVAKLENKLKHSSRKSVEYTVSKTPYVEVKVKNLQKALAVRDKALSGFKKKFELVIEETKAQSLRADRKLPRIGNRNQLIGAGTPKGNNKLVTASISKRKLAVEAQESTKSASKNLEISRSNFDGERVVTHPKYGIIFTKKPQKADDLKKIYGVGKVLEKALNKFGVYRFKQIALWTPSIVSVFTDDLPFGDRVGRDNWIKQAKKLHATKYGEKI